MKELRYRPTEFRVAEGPDGQRHLSGYAAKYGVLSEELFEPSIGQGFREIILQGAFAERTQDDVTLNFEHDDRLGIFGRTISGTLSLTDDSEGLLFDCVLPDTTAARDASVLLGRGDLCYCSFAFDCDPDSEEWDMTDSGVPLRKIARVAQLYDVSIVVRPAYVFDTELSIRSREALQARTTVAQADPHTERRRLLDLHEKF